MQIVGEQKVKVNGLFFGSRPALLVETRTVPPGESLQGAVYFKSPAPELGRRAPADAAYAYDLTLHLPTPDGPKRIALRPVPART
jgi:hypothetical protein